MPNAYTTSSRCTKVKLSAIVGDALREVNVGRDLLAVEVTEEGAQNWDVVVALELKLDVFG